jgi:hypothetical protein
MYENTLLKLLETYPNKKWDYENLSENLSVPLQYILENSHKFVNCWLNISMRSDVTFDIIKKYTEYPWSFNGFSSNPNLTIDIVKKNLEYDWNWYLISSNENVVNDEVYLNNPQLPWHYIGLSMIKNLSWNVIEKNIDKFSINGLSKYNHNITFDIAQKFNYLDWDYTYLSMNPNITIDIILNNTSYRWDMYCFSQNKNVTPEVVEKYPDFPWDHDGLSQNDNFTLFDIHKLKIKIGKCDLYYLSSDSKTNFMKLLNNKNIQINLSGLSSNPTVTMDIYYTHNHIKWCDYGLSRNPNLNFDFVSENIHKIYFTQLSKNIFLKDKIALKNYITKSYHNRIINRILFNDKRLYNSINIIINKFIN